MILTKADVTEQINILLELWESLFPTVMSFAKNLVIAIIVLFVGKKLIKLLLHIMRKAFEKAKTDIGVVGFLNSLIKIILYIALAVLVADILGLPTTSFLTLLGSAGLAIGLALQGSLANFAGGVLILLLKPFVVGDSIIVGTNDGVVETIDIFYTKIITCDNKVIVMPNGTLSNSNIINVTKKPIRRLDLLIPIAYDQDIRIAKKALEQIALKSSYLLPNTVPELFVNGFGENALELGLRCFVSRENYWLLRCELLEAIKYQFDEQNISIPLKQVVVHTGSFDEKRN